MKRSFRRNVVIVALLSVCVGVGWGQTKVSNDLLETPSSSGSNEDLSSLGLGTVGFQGVALSADTGPADTIVQHNALPSGGGTVNIQVIALHLQNTGTVTCGSQALCGSFFGKSVEVHATINVASATNNHISLPQPDALDPSVGTMTVPSASSPTNLLSFDSSFSNIEADIIVVQVGAGVNGTPIFTAKAPATSMSAGGGVLSNTAPGGYPNSVNFPTVAPYVTQLAGGSAAFLTGPFGRAIRGSLWGLACLLAGFSLWTVWSGLKNGRVGWRPVYLTAFALVAGLTAWKLQSFSLPNIVYAEHCPRLVCKPITAEQSLLIKHGAAPAPQCQLITCPFIP